MHNMLLEATLRLIMKLLTALTLLNLHDHSFCFCGKLLSLPHLEHSTKSNVLTRLALLLSLTLNLCT
jgi:hypothetical protein